MAQGSYSQSGFSYRQGRTYYVPGKKDTTCQTIFLTLFFVLFLVGFPIVLFSAEYNFALLVASISEVSPEVVEVDNPDQVPWHGRKIVHTTGMVNRDAEVVDQSFNVHVPALKMQRWTEYCQWMEHRTEECETCHKSKTKSDGSSTTTSYKCNCKIRYHYTKGWTNYRINSLLFDQPAAHYNPQRDPFPSRSFVSQNAKVNGFSLDPSLLQNLKAQTFSIDWNDQAERQPQFYDFLWLPIKNYFGLAKTQYRHQYELDSVRSSPAALDHAFFYIGHGGYFFSPYKSTQQEMVLKWLGQALEGSLMDWQLGDFFGCTPGDIRVSYSAQLPPMVSAIGRSTAQHASDVQQGLGLISTQEGKKQLGFIHEGEVSSDDMFQREVDEEKSSLRIIRIAFLLWAAVIADALLLYFGIHHSSRSIGTGVLGVWGIALSIARMMAESSISFSWWPSLFYFVCSCGVLGVSMTYFPKVESGGWGAVKVRYQWITGETEVTTKPKKMSAS